MPVLDTMIRDNKPISEEQRTETEILEHYISCARKKFHKLWKKNIKIQYKIFQKAYNVFFVRTKWLSLGSRMVYLHYHLAVKIWTNRQGANLSSSNFQETSIVMYMKGMNVHKKDPYTKLIFVLSSTKKQRNVKKFLQARCYRRERVQRRLLGTSSVFPYFTSLMVRTSKKNTDRQFSCQNRWTEVYRWISSQPQ